MTIKTITKEALTTASRQLGLAQPVWGERGQVHHPSSRDFRGPLWRPFRSFLFSLTFFFLTFVFGMTKSRSGTESVALSLICNKWNDSRSKLDIFQLFKLALLTRNHSLLSISLASVRLNMIFTKCSCARFLAFNHNLL